MLRSQSDTRLFNACCNDREPDWTRYASLEIAGCTNDGSGDINGLQAAAKAEFFTIYGRNQEGLAEAITDVVDPRDALQVAADLIIRSKLPLEVSISLAAC